MANKGQIGVTTENIFPVIKQFLYSDHEIFLRELVANAVDASQKMKTLASNGEFKGELGDLDVKVVLDESAKTLKIIDRGIGMTEEEVDKYINQIAFSSAGEFLEKYKDQNIIGHFGLGFYSAFMVATKVTIETLSWKEGAKAVRWSCEGNPEFEMEECDKAGRGTEITLYLDDDSARDYGTKDKIGSLLTKYCRFMPVKVVFGKKQEWKDGKYVDTDEDNVINNIDPIWTRKPSDLKEEDYQKFYRELYPMKEEPLFHIHLNVDYPFNLTGVLYFPKLKERMAIEKNQIQLYCNQMFVTDHVENIVPEFLTLLHGVIDSPDIPLNVSRSYLQSDENVKKISTYITRKVADRLDEIFRNEREAWEKKWDNLKLFIEYGMLSDEKFCERAMKFALLKNTDGKYFSFEDYRKAVADQQTDKDKKVVYLYATNTDAQYPYIEAAKTKGYDVLLMDCELDSHFVNLLEQKLTDTRFARVDSDSAENLIPKDDRVRLEMKEDERYDLENMFKAVLPAGNDYYVNGDNLGENSDPVLITQSEFMRRYREMSALGGGMNFYGEMPASYNITVNMQNPLIVKIMEAAKASVKPQAELPAEAPETATEEEKKAARDAREAVRVAHREDVEEFSRGNEILRQVIDLALLSNGMLKGKALADFIARSRKVVSDAYLK
ncbi:MAG: molecular chaperone HtpG [Bacteroidales bacterium]|uniref:molecular chaperone HtpG n=1 Tax=Candidatus Cryptobacteroides sp. TaxID=2952915 RepID=UPI002A75ED08|nr:molecular chaperone HtpG [Candidatus Cryptobacteroides sp.]MDD7234998.1 molecular chaperone HtpG [Bacteroidales bacterium]MDY2701421.1 molecular chaperone HtpG [Candidatus Cryptobacteroides sp.]